MKMWKGMMALALTVGLLLIGGKAALAEGLLLTDFDYGEKSSDTVKDFGAWDKDPDDPTQTCVLDFDADVFHGKDGMSLRLDYDVDSPNPAYNGFWMQLNNLDLKGKTKLVLFIKGDPERKFTKKIKLELKSPKKVGRHVLKGITGAWQRFEIPLEKFKGLDTKEDIVEMVVVFDDVNTRPKTGTIYIDDIYFE